MSHGNSVSSAFPPDIARQNKLKCRSRHLKQFIRHAGGHVIWQLSARQILRSHCFPSPFRCPSFLDSKFGQAVSEGEYTEFIQLVSLFFRWKRYKGHKCYLPPANVICHALCYLPLANPFLSFSPIDFSSISFIFYLVVSQQNFYCKYCPSEASDTL
jgi:hypothetical protein